MHLVTLQGRNAYTLLNNVSVLEKLSSVHRA